MVWTETVLTIIIKTGPCRPRNRNSPGLVGRVEIGIKK